MKWKHVLGPALFATLMTAPLTAQVHADMPFTGEWELEFPAPWGVVVWTFDFQADGTSFSGSYDPGMGLMMLEGMVKENDVEFGIELVDGPHPFSLNFWGERDPDGATGTVQFEDGSSGEWTLRRPGD